MLDVSAQTFVIPPVTWLTSQLLSGSSITGIDISIMLPECSSCMRVGLWGKRVRADFGHAVRKINGSILFRIRLRAKSITLEKIYNSD